MPSLIPEILFAIGKKLIEDRNSDAVLRFALSGKESLKAMKNVFASVTLLGLYREGYAIGGGNGLTQFQLQNDKPFCKFLMDQIGNRVETLHLDIDGITEMYQTVLDKIIANPRVITLSVGSRCSRLFLDKFYHVVSTSLKNVTIPSSIMHNVFRDSLNLDSLIVLNSNGDDHLSFCCKTKSLKLYLFRPAIISIYSASTLHAFRPTVDLISPHLSTVKKLIFTARADSFSFYATNDIMIHFPALEVIQYNEGLSKNVDVSTNSRIFTAIKFFQKIIIMDAALPQKYVCKFYKCNKFMEFPSFDTCKKFFDASRYYDETNQKFDDDEMKDFHCFRLNIPSKVDETRTTIFEIQIAK